MNSQFSFSDKYRLDIKWTKVIYEKDGEATLENCTLSGPVISDVVKLQVMDSIRLDFVSQYIHLLSDYYIADLSWFGVAYKDDNIALSNVKLTCRHINSIPKLNDNDYIVVDTTNHEEEVHVNNLNYKAYLIRNDGTKYNFVG